jgi:hypothetical protein
MIKNISAALRTYKGRIVVSMLLGIGLASLFRRVCNDRNCLVFKSPPVDEVTKNTYAYGDKCYKFKEKTMKCGMTEKQVTA